MQLAEQAHDVAARRRIEVAGRLVGQQDARLGDERARHRDALPLAAGHLARPVIHALAEPTRSSACLRALDALLALQARVDQRQLDVVQRVRARQQIEGLKHEADFLVAHARELAIVHLRDELAVQPILAVVRRVEAADHVHQRRFAGARRPHDRHVLAALDREIDAAQRIDRLLAHSVVALQVVRFDGRHPSARCRVRLPSRRDYRIAAPRLHRRARRKPLGLKHS